MLFFGLAFILIANLLILRSFYVDKTIGPLFLPTATPTRVSNSYAAEGQIQFYAGNLDLAVEAYRKALETDPQNAQIWAELARIQTYSSSLATTDTDRKARLADALESANQAKAIDPENSTVLAVRAFVLDWNANTSLVGDEKAQTLLLEAEQEAVQALQADNKNTLALAYYAEILNDQLKWEQASQYIEEALLRDPNLMDAHRIKAMISETFADYAGAIEEYKRASEIAPNLTFLYISIGQNLRILERYEESVEYFAKAATINKQLGVEDPIPYLAIANTYSQTGDFYSAALNARKALQFNPNSPDVYGRLGVIYYKSRNFEGSIPALSCAINGCDPTVSCEVRKCDEETDPEITIEGMPLSDNTLVYYFTYASALAAMHRSDNNYCAEATVLFEKLLTTYPTDPTVLSVVDAGEAICIKYGFSAPTPEAP